MRKTLRLLPWIIVSMAFFATALSFLDRQVLSVSILKITEDFAINDVEYGFINTGFFKPDVRTFLHRWIKEGPTHHFALGTGHHAKSLQIIADYLGIESVIVTPG